MISVNSLFVPRPTFVMGPLHFLSHALNFVAPALFIALLLPTANRWVLRQAPLRPVWWVQVTMHFLVGSAVLLGGLIFFGSDGKMLSYLALVLACATSQWALGGWRK
jgi:hypothetical protein